MRIAWVLYGDLTQRTGGTIYDAHVVEGLRRAGDLVLVLSLEPFREGSSLARASRIVKAAMQLVQEMETFNPDVVVGDELCFRELALTFRLLSRHVQTPKRILLVHHLTAWETELSEVQHADARADERRAIDACDTIFTTSQTTRARLRSEGVKEEIHVVLPGADRLPLLANEGFVARPVLLPHFVFVGSVVPRKRVVELTRAFARCGAGHLAIVGSTTRDPAYVSEVRALIAEHGIASLVSLTGELDELGVARALASADVFVMPSSLEGYGIAATEAIRAGLPVIAARAQGLEEALASCPNARIFADDEAALAAAMERFANDPGLRSTMLEAARTASTQMPSWSDCVDRFRALLATFAPRAR